MVYFGERCSVFRNTNLNIIHPENPGSERRQRKEMSEPQMKDDLI